MRKIGEIGIIGPDTKATMFMRIYKSDTSSDLYIAAEDIYKVLRIEGFGFSFEEWVQTCGDAARTTNHVLLAGNTDDSPVLFSAMFVFKDMADHIPYECHKLMPMLGMAVERFLKGLRDEKAEDGNSEDDCGCPGCKAARNMPSGAMQSQFMNYTALQAGITTTRISQIVHCLERATDMGFDDTQLNALRAALLNYLVYDGEMHKPSNMRSENRDSDDFGKFPDILTAEDLS